MKNTSELNRFHKNIENIINLNLKIDNSIFKYTQFFDKNIEKKFQEDRKIKESKQRILSDIILIFGYLASIFYIFFAFYRLPFVIICIICKGSSIMLMILTLYIKNENFVYFCEHMNVFLIAITLSLKSFLVCLIYFSKDNDNEMELIRIIIYYFVSTNIFIFLKFEANIFIYIFYFLINLFMIIIASIYSNKNHSYYLEGFTSFLYFAIFFSFRKVWDNLMRKIFSEKFKFERYYNYTIEFSTGLNSFHITINNNELIYMDQKFEKLCAYLTENYKEFSHSNNKNLSLNITSDCNGSQDNLHIITNTPLWLGNSDKNNFFTDFSRNLIPFKEEYISNDNINLNQEISKEEEIIESNILKNLDNLNVKEVSLFIFLNILKREENIKKEQDKNANDTSENTSFINLGIYNFKNPNIKRYFDVCYRRINLRNNNLVCDILFTDVSELILSKKIIYEENLIKQKVLAKIAHEFKTPINSIIGLINNIKENSTDNNGENNFINELEHRKNESKVNNRLLDIIQNLSKYVIFLVSDIIQYSNIKDLNQITLKYEKLKLRELGTFSVEILRCLLKCNKLKNESIRTELIFDKEIDDLDVYLDEIRLKQIILNIISNSVKFTKCGFIYLIFTYDKKENQILINIKDTGIGIREEDKYKLFNDFVMLNNGISHNNQGSGLGLSICKSLAIKMNLKLMFESVYGEGTNFIISLPVKKFEQNIGLTRKNSDDILSSSKKQKLIENEGTPPYKIISYYSARDKKQIDLDINVKFFII